MINSAGPEGAAWEGVKIRLSLLFASISAALSASCCSFCFSSSISSPFAAEESRCEEQPEEGECPASLSAAVAAHFLYADDKPTSSETEAELREGEHIA